MYFHVYADIVMLSKSNDLGKTVLDMNQHYLELKLYLQEVECDPSVVMDKHYQVFRSEEKLQWRRQGRFEGVRSNPLLRGTILLNKLLCFLCSQRDFT